MRRWEDDVRFHVGQNFRHKGPPYLDSFPIPVQNQEEIYHFPSAESPCEPLAFASVKRGFWRICLAYWREEQDGYPMQTSLNEPKIQTLFVLGAGRLWLTGRDSTTLFQPSLLRLAPDPSLQVPHLVHSVRRMVVNVAVLGLVEVSNRTQHTQTVHTTNATSW